MPTMTWVAPNRTASCAASRPSRRLSAVVPAGTWATMANPAGSRPTASRAARIASRRPAKYVMSVGFLSAVTAGRSQPSATAAASAMPRRFWPPSQIGGPPGRQGRRVVRRADQRVERIVTGHAGGRGRRRGVERADRVDRGFEPVEPLGHRRVGDREGRVLRVEPAGPETEDEAPARRMIHDRRRLREHRRVAERDGQDGVAQPLARHVVGEGGHGGERLERRAGAILPDVGEVIVHPDAAEHVVLADPCPRRIQRRPVDPLRRGLDPDLDAARRGRRHAVSVLAGSRSSGSRSSPRRATPNRRGPRTWP